MRTLTKVGRIVNIGSLVVALLLLASGIQCAGPELTPQSFEDGLRGLGSGVCKGWPNPGTIYGAASVGDLSQHWMNQDASIMWWNPSGQSHWDATRPGRWCYAENAKRRLTNQWPNAYAPDPNNSDPSQPHRIPLFFPSSCGP